MSEPKTLGFYRDLCVALYGEASAAVKFFDDKIAEQGRDQRVLADEYQMLMLMKSLRGAPNPKSN